MADGVMSMERKEIAKEVFTILRRKTRMESLRGGEAMRAWIKIVMSKLNQGRDTRKKDERSVQLLKNVLVINFFRKFKNKIVKHFC